MLSSSAPRPRRKRKTQQREIKAARWATPESYPEGAPRAGVEATAVMAARVRFKETEPLLMRNVVDRVATRPGLVEVERSRRDGTRFAGRICASQRSIGKDSGPNTRRPDWGCHGRHSSGTLRRTLRAAAYRSIP